MQGIAFLEGKCRDYKGVAEPSALLKTVIAHMHVVASQFDKAKEILSEVQGVLDTAIGIDPSVYSQFYRVLSIFHKNQVHAGEFYKAGLLYLAYTPLESLSLPVRRELARDLGIAGLVAEDVYGLGELLSHSLVTSLEQDAELKWLIELMHAFNSGHIEVWQKLKTQYAQQVSQHASLAQNMSTLLEEKIAILALIELIWSRPADGRTLPFAAIAAHTHVNLDRVELLVMRALSLKLVQGELDQVHALFVVSSVTSRILTLEQVATMQGRVKAWAEHVQATLVQVEGESASIL